MKSSDQKGIQRRLLFTVTLLYQAIKTNREVINYHWQLSEFLNVISWVTVQLVSNIVPSLSIILEKRTKVKPNQRKQDFSGTQDDTQFYYINCSVLQGFLPPRNVVSELT